MARHWKWLRRGNSGSSVKTCDWRFIPHGSLCLHFIRKSKWSIRAIKYIQMWMNILLSVGVLLNLFFLQRRPTSANWWSAELSFWPSRIVLSAMYHFQCGLVDARSLIRVTQGWILRSQSSGLVPSLSLIISKMYFSHWKPPGVSEGMWSVNLDASISGEYGTLGGHSSWPSE